MTIMRKETKERKCALEMIGMRNGKERTIVLIKKKDSNGKGWNGGKNGNGEKVFVNKRDNKDKE